MRGPSRHLGSRPPGRRRRLRVGLLGGSFNPAHQGHRYISELALKALALDQVWWLVSPQNPLKEPADMAPYSERLELAHAHARHPRIHVTDIERRLGTRYTIDVLDALRHRYPGIDFVWIMGADNLAEIPRWRHWRRIFRNVPVAIFNRSSYSVEALAGEAAREFRAYRVNAAQARALASKRPPVWVFIWAARHTASASALRDEDARRAANEEG